MLYYNYMNVDPPVLMCVFVIYNVQRKNNKLIARNLFFNKITI